MKMTLAQEASRITKLLKGKSLKVVRRHRATELLLEFEDGMRLFVDLTKDNKLEFSVTGGNNDED